MPCYKPKHFQIKNKDDLPSKESSIKSTLHKCFCKNQTAIFKTQQ